MSVIEESINTSYPFLDYKIKEWLMWDKNEKTLKEVHDMVAEGNTEKLSKLFLNRLEFGTAGLRGRMGAGFNQINDLVVIQTAQGLSEFILTYFKNVEEKSIVVGYDGRYNSKRFAELTAAVFLNKKIKVYLFSDLCPTPFVAFATKHYNCVAGVMVTASHNPKEDNGYKVYWQNGVQIIYPLDIHIQESIIKNLEPLESSWATSKIYINPLLVDPMADIMVAYYDKLKDIVLFPEVNQYSSVNTVYTPMHGVGYKYVARAFEVANLDIFYPVLQQVFPDPEFPTVPFPNPEEGKSALNLAIKAANENNCFLILANDPDADRLAVAEKIKNSKNEWKIFNGNELGVLLGWWLFFCFKHQNNGLKNFDDVYMLSSTVSSKILSTMAKFEGFKFEETLTGFKWMGDKAHTLINNKKTVLFAFEEAIGFMCGTAVLDKDGVSAAVKVGEMAAYLKENFDMTLQEKLAELYATYGHHITLNSYFICYDQEKINAIFHRLRNFSHKTNRSYPKSILNGKYQVSGVRDLTTGYDDSELDKKAKLPVSKSSQMITFKFSNGFIATLRTSGTEPKLKYYSELCADPKQQDVEQLHKIVKEMIDGIVDEFLQPSLNGLLPRTE